MMLSRPLKMILVGSYAALLGLLAPVVFPVSASAQQKAEARSGALYVVTYVDVFPNFTDDTMKALRQFATDSRKDLGSVRFEFFRTSCEPTISASLRSGKTARHMMHT